MPKIFSYFLKVKFISQNQLLQRVGSITKVGISPQRVEIFEKHLSLAKIECVTCPMMYIASNCEIWIFFLEIQIFGVKVNKSCCIIIYYDTAGLRWLNFSFVL